jgi:hypothetical protein
MISCVLYSCLLFVSAETLVDWALDPSYIEEENQEPQETMPFDLSRIHSCLAMRNRGEAFERPQVLWRYPTLRSFMAIRQQRQLSEKHKEFLRNLDVISSLLVAIVINSATELTIRWNALDGTYSLQSVGQMIPFVMVVFLLVHVVYEWITTSRAITPQITARAMSSKRVSAGANCYNKLWNSSRH